MSFTGTWKVFRKVFPKREQELERYIKSNVEEKQFNIMKEKIKPLCETRWIERHTAFEDLHVLYKYVLDCLGNMKNNNNRMWNPKTVIEGSGILNQMTDAKFFISFHTFKFHLGFTKPLSTALQGSDMDVVNGYASVTTLTNELQEIRSNEEKEFAGIFRDANATAAEMGKEIKVPRVVGRQLLRSNV